MAIICVCMHLRERERERERERKKECVEAQNPSSEIVLEQDDNKNKKTTKTRRTTAMQNLFNPTIPLRVDSKEGISPDAP